jgi:hypothetical protein
VRRRPTCRASRFAFRRIWPRHRTGSFCARDRSPRGHVAASHAARLLALAHHFQELLDTGAVETQAELAELTKLTPARERASQLEQRMTELRDELATVQPRPCRSLDPTRCRALRSGLGPAPRPRALPHPAPAPRVRRLRRFHGRAGAWVYPLDITSLAAEAAPIRQPAEVAA